MVLTEGRGFAQRSEEILWLCVRLFNSALSDFVNSVSGFSAGNLLGPSWWAIRLKLLVLGLMLGGVAKRQEKSEM